MSFRELSKSHRINTVVLGKRNKFVFFFFGWNAFCVNSKYSLLENLLLLCWRNCLCVEMLFKYKKTRDSMTKMSLYGNCGWRRKTVRRFQKKKKKKSIVVEESPWMLTTAFWSYRNTRSLRICGFCFLLIGDLASFFLSPRSLTSECSIYSFFFF